MTVCNIFKERERERDSLVTLRTVVLARQGRRVAQRAHEQRNAKLALQFLDLHAVPLHLHLLRIDSCVQWVGSAIENRSFRKAIPSPEAMYTRSGDK